MKNETGRLDNKRIDPPTQKNMPWEDFYRLYRQSIVDEHNILNQRTVWLAISQSFFFGGYAAVVNAPKESKSPLFAGQQDLLLWLIPAAALIACFCIFVGVIARNISIQQLRQKFALYTDVDENYPPLDASDTIKAMENFSIWVLPLVFMVTWAFIIAKQFLSE